MVAVFGAEIPVIEVLIFLSLISVVILAEGIVLLIFIIKLYKQSKVAVKNQEQSPKTFLKR